MIMVLADRFRWSGGLLVPVSAYDLTPGCPPGQAEDLKEPGLVAGELGGHAACFGAAAGGGVNQHGLADAR